jgi:hypothetical protein
VSTIKAIETRYKGYRFRSRLEARWAVFLETVGLRWRYETEGFEFGPEIRYLPDFYLPDWDIFLEIKPELPCVQLEEVGHGRNMVIAMDERGFTPIGKFLIAALNLQTTETDPSTGKELARNRLYMACGTPGVPTLVDYKGRWLLKDGSVLMTATPLDGVVFQLQAWSDNDKGDLDIWPFYLNGQAKPGYKECESALWPKGTMRNFYVGEGRSYGSARLTKAYTAARSARFEHGERP